MNLLATLVSFFTLGLLVILIIQMRIQRQATYDLLADSRIRTRLYEDADETTSLVLARTIHNISDGQPDASLDSDIFTLKVVRELVKQKIAKEKWLEIQSNQRLVYELFLLLRNTDGNNRPPERQTTN